MMSAWCANLPRLGCTRIEYAVFTVSWFSYRLYCQIEIGRLKWCAGSVVLPFDDGDSPLDIAVQTWEKSMSPALIWIDIIVISAVIAVYLANRPGTPGLPSSSYYLNGKGPKP